TLQTLRNKLITKSNSNCCYSSPERMVLFVQKLIENNSIQELNLEIASNGSRRNLLVSKKHLDAYGVEFLGRVMTHHGAGTVIGPTEENLYIFLDKDQYSSGCYDLSLKETSTLSPLAMDYSTTASHPTFSIILSTLQEIVFEHHQLKTKNKEHVF